MKVAFITPELDPGYGWGRYSVDLAQALADQGQPVVVLTQHTTPPPDAPYAAAIRPVLPALMPRPRAFLVRCLLRAPLVARAVRDVDLLHVIAEPYAPLAALVAGKRPLVVTAHGTYVPQTSRRRAVGWLYRRAYRRSTIVAVSRYTADQVVRALEGCHLQVVHNGVHFDHWQQPGPAPAQRGPTVLATGGVKPRKGTRDLVDALALVRQRVPDVQLVVTGNDDPDYRASVQASVDGYGLADQIHFLGMIPDDELRGWYQHADVFALPSVNIGGKFEGFGLVYLEAGACGLPVIGTTGSGAAEAIVDGETGLLVAQYDSRALADALIRLLSDHDLRVRMGAAGRARARAHDWSAAARRMRAIYRWVSA